uniref:CDAN1-interacting nuclease 1 n=1 Tax=Tetradesmus obliquus TaxID=3088 RepID=A0A383WBB4_TETOB|eukprot:jgi/Sobl393_1/2852/SZX73986.1
MSGLPRETYQQILHDVDIPVMSCAHLGLLAARYPGVRPETICGILAQENQYTVIKSHHIHKANMPAYCSRYVTGEDVLALCAEVDFPPCLMMRRMLELLMRLSKQAVSDMLKDPLLLPQQQHHHDRIACLQEWLAAAAAHSQQGQQQQHRHKQQQKAHEQYQPQQKHREQQPMQQSSSMDVALMLQRLQADIVRCVHADSSYSPYCDMAKSLAGLEHEAKLYAELARADIPFWTEQQLRQKGLFKTPDALLQVPICARAGPGDAWHLVHWIDSKASFGDARTHSSQLEAQYRTYTNRYGPGLVIYWLGFLAGMENDAEVLLLEAFPGQADLLQLPRLAVPQLGPATAAAGDNITGGAAADAAAIKAPAAGSTGGAAANTAGIGAVSGSTAVYAQ